MPSATGHLRPQTIPYRHSEEQRCCDMGVSPHTLLCHSEEPKATWESRRRESVRRTGFCRPRNRDSHVGRSVLLRMTGWAYRPRTYTPTEFLTCGLPPSRLGKKSKLFLLSTWRRFTPLRFTQNDKMMEIPYKELCANFSSKCHRCDSPTERDDGLYWRTAHWQATKRGSRCGIFMENFSSKAVLYNANEDPPDRTY